MAELYTSIGFIPGGCDRPTPSVAVWSISCDLIEVNLFMSSLLGGCDCLALLKAKKNRRGETLGSVRPRRLTRQRAPRNGRGALHLVIRRRQFRYFAERLCLIDSDDCIALPWE